MAEITLDYWPAAESKAEQILVFMSLSPASEYTSAQLAEVADIQPKNVHTLLGPCVKHGLVTRQCTGRQAARWKLATGTEPVVAKQCGPQMHGDSVPKQTRVWRKSATQQPDLPTTPVETCLGNAWLVPVAVRSVFDLGAH